MPAPRFDKTDQDRIADDVRVGATTATAILFIKQPCSDARRVIDRFADLPTALTSPAEMAA